MTLSNNFFSIKTLQRISNSGALKMLYVSSPVSFQLYKKQNGQKNTTPINSKHTQGEDLSAQFCLYISILQSTIRASSIFHVLFKTMSLMVFAFRIRFLAKQNTKLYHKYTALI